LLRALLSPGVVLATSLLAELGLARDATAPLALAVLVLEGVTSLAPRSLGVLLVGLGPLPGLLEPRPHPARLPEV